MSVNELRDYFSENFYKQIGFVKQRSYYAMTRLKKRFVVACNKINGKITDPRNAKEHCQSFIGKKNTKSVKQSGIITYQQKVFENSNIVVIKSGIIKHSKTSHKLSKTENFSQVGSNSSLYSNTKKVKFSKRKKCKNNKNKHMLLKVLQVLAMLKFF